MMLYGIKKEKSRYREECLQKRRCMPKEIKAEYEQKICDHIINSISYKYYDTLLLYAALPDEPDLSYLAKKALADGKRVAYPRCIPGTHDMTFYYVSDPAVLSAGSYGIMEPSEHLPVFDKCSLKCHHCYSHTPLPIFLALP